VRTLEFVVSKPLKCLVTGAAGFIGSRLCQRLLEKGHKVTGLDDFSDYYPKRIKLRNLSPLVKDNGFEFVEADLARDNLSKPVQGVDYVFHLAAQPGVRASWGSSFSIYIKDNVLATQRLLEAVKGAGVKRFILASSSSIYGDSEQYPTPEDVVPKPVSPYGVTKLAAEHLCHVYLHNYDLPAVVLRYFTVYGPRQRPDMAFSIFISRMVTGKEITIYGDGSQQRDFTYVDDIVSATMSAVDARSGTIYNVGSSEPKAVNEVIETLEDILQKKARVKRTAFASGDVRRTCADITRIAADLGYGTTCSLREGLKRQIEGN